MKIILKRGEALDIKLLDADGGFRVIYGETQVDVRAELPDTSGREGLIYREKYGGGAAVRTKVFPKPGPEPILDDHGQGSGQVAGDV